MIDTEMRSSGIILCDQCESELFRVSYDESGMYVIPYSNRILLEVIITEGDTEKVTHFCSGECFHEFLKDIDTNMIKSIQFVTPYVETIDKYLGGGRFHVSYKVHTRKYIYQKYLDK